MWPKWTPEYFASRDFYIPETITTWRRIRIVGVVDRRATTERMRLTQIMSFTSRIETAAFRLSLKYKLYAAYYGQFKCETEIFLQLFIRLLVVEYCVLNNFKYISMYFCIFTKSAIKGFSSIMFFDASQSHFWFFAIQLEKFLHALALLVWFSLFVVLIVLQFIVN